MCDTCRFRDLCFNWVPGGCVFYEPASDQHTESTPETPQRRDTVVLVREPSVFRHPPIWA